MALRFRLPRPSFTFCLQAAACAVVAWSLWNGGLNAPAGASAPGASAAGGAAAETAAPPATMPTTPTTRGAAAATPSAAGTAPPTVALASTAGFEGARLVLSSIDVIVSRNDTLDRIFRRLKLSLADLASLRALPGLKARLDSLRPGESLHLTHKDGELYGLQRRLSDSESLDVVRGTAGLEASVVENPLEMRTRTFGGRISSSIF